MEAVLGFSEQHPGPPDPAMKAQEPGPGLKIKPTGP